MLLAFSARLWYDTSVVQTACAAIAKSVFFGTIDLTNAPICERMNKMKKISLVALILCVSVFLLTACTSLSTYIDRLAVLDKNVAAYTIEEFKDSIDEYAEKYEVNPEDYSIIESITAKDNISGGKMAIIATWSEGKAEKLAEDLNAAVAADGYQAVCDGRFVIVGNEIGINHALGK
mgnify:CR=1 FL=1